MCKKIQKEGKEIVLKKKKEKGAHPNEAHTHTLPDLGYNLPACAVDSRKVSCP